MSHDSHPSPALFTQVDITAGTQLSRSQNGGESADEQVGLLRSILAAQDRQNELMEESAGFGPAATGSGTGPVEASES
jgi:hypothetical protein